MVAQAMAVYKNLEAAQGRVAVNKTVEEAETRTGVLTVLVAELLFYKWNITRIADSDWTYLIPHQCC